MNPGPQLQELLQAQGTALWLTGHCSEPAVRAAHAVHAAEPCVVHAVHAAEHVGPFESDALLALAHPREVHAVHAALQAAEPCQVHAPVACADSRGAHAVRCVHVDSAEMHTQQAKAGARVHSADDYAQKHQAPPDEVHVLQQVFHLP